MAHLEKGRKHTRVHLFYKWNGPRDVNLSDADGR